MNRHSHFFSLSGMPGILAGIYAIIGALLAIVLINNYHNANSFISLLPISYLEYLLAGIAILVLILSIFTVFRYSNRKARKSNEKLWNTSSKRLLLNFCLPLFTGGAFCMVLFQFGFIGLIPPSMLIFYGLACLTVVQFTSGKIRNLGISNVIIGLISTQFIDFGLYFWAFGFGCLHILYGLLRYPKYDNEN